MTQFDVYDFLVKNQGKEFTTKQVSEAVGICRNTVALNCKKICKIKGFNRTPTYKIGAIEYVYGYKVKKCKKN